MEVDFPHLPAHMNTNQRSCWGERADHYTSLKEHKFNKMYWKLQGEHFNSKEPAVLVVPLLPMEEILKWTSNREHAVDCDVAVLTFGRKHRVVAKETRIWRACLHRQGSHDPWHVTTGFLATSSQVCHQLLGP